MTCNSRLAESCPFFWQPAYKINVLYRKFGLKAIQILEEFILGKNHGHSKRGALSPPKQKEHNSFKILTNRGWWKACFLYYFIKILLFLYRMLDSQGPAILKKWTFRKWLFIDLLYNENMYPTFHTSAIWEMLVSELKYWHTYSNIFQISPHKRVGKTIERRKCCC